MSPPVDPSSDTPKPLLVPQVRILWTFALVTASAVLIMMVRWAQQGQALIVALVGILIWLAVVFAMFACLFLITYALGWLENLLAPPEPEILSPFATDRLPEQVVEPINADLR